MTETDAPKVITQTYPGDARPFDPNQIIGPSARDMRRFTITGMTYDAARDVTVATLTPVSPEDYRGLLAPKVANAQEWVRVRNFFHDGGSR